MEIHRVTCNVLHNTRRKCFEKNPCQRRIFNENFHRKIFLPLMVNSLQTPDTNQWTMNNSFFILTVLIFRSFSLIFFLLILSLSLDGMFVREKFVQTYMHAMKIIIKKIFLFFQYIYRVRNKMCTHNKFSYHEASTTT